MDHFSTATKILFPYAYNILGNVADSQDIVQQALINYHEKEAATIAEPKAYLIKSVVNLAINQKKKKERGRDLNINLPEPIVNNLAEHTIELDEILNYSLMVLLNTVNAKERAIFLLKEAFDYEHREIAEILSISVENSRQLLARAKKKLKSQQPTIVSPNLNHTAYLERYMNAIRERDVKSLEKLLADDIQVLADGGTEVNVVAPITIGIENTLKLVSYLYQHYQKDFSIKIEEANHQAALLFYRGASLINCQVFEINAEGKITRIFSVVDPQKLKSY